MKKKNKMLVEVRHTEQRTEYYVVDKDVFLKECKTAEDVMETGDWVCNKKPSSVLNNIVSIEEVK